MSPTRTRGASGVDGFPRVSGDEPGECTLLPLKQLFSPRERG